MSDFKKFLQIENFVVALSKYPKSSMSLCTVARCRESSRCRFFLRQVTLFTKMFLIASPKFWQIFSSETSLPRHSPSSPQPCLGVKWNLFCSVFDKMHHHSLTANTNHNILITRFSILFQNKQLSFVFFKIVLKSLA